MPIKAAILPFLDEVSPESQITGACNTIVKVPTPNGGFKLVGQNTDSAFGLMSWHLHLSDSCQSSAYEMLYSVRLRSSTQIPPPRYLLMPPHHIPHSPLLLARLLAWLLGAVPQPARRHMPSRFSGSLLSSSSTATWKRCAQSWTLCRT